jgi:hypothetical protein
VDPVTAATSFATIVGLLSNFKSERSGTQLSEFIEWLKEKRHDDVAQSIEHNQMLAVQLKSILALNHQELVQRLDSLDAVLASVASHVETFSNLATTIRQDSVLSEQAISIVRQFADSGANEMWEQKYIGGTRYHFISGTGSLEVQEPRFIEDDLNTLIELGIFRLDYGGKGTRRFIITRQAVQLAKSRDR